MLFALSSTYLSLLFETRVKSIKPLMDSNEAAARNFKIDRLIIYIPYSCYAVVQNSVQMI